jgi:hypothetical protein
MKWFNTSLTALAIIGALLVGVVSYKDIPVWKLFLVKDFNSLDFSVLLNKEQNFMGEIESLAGSGLKRRMMNEGVFNKLRLSDQVFNGDIIITDALTKAVVKFKDGSTLVIDPGSMVKLEFHSDKTGLLAIAKTPKVAVLSGSVTGTAGLKDLNITNLQGQSLTVAPAETNKVQVKAKVKPLVKINPERLTKLNLPPPAPKPVPVVEEIKPIAVAKAEPLPVVPPVVPPKAVIPKELPRKIASVPATAALGVLDVEPVKIAGLKGLNSNLYQGEDIRTFFVDLKWEAVQQADGYNVEFFLDSALTKPWFQVQTENNYYRLTQIINGTVYYQVIALHRKKAIGKTKPQALTFNYNGPELKNPKSGSLLSAQEGTYYFTWEKTNFTEKYVLEISKTQDFSKIVKKEVDSNFIQIPLLQGTYYWRVSAMMGQVVSRPSKINVVVIK